jgi:hypothetical protein
MDMSISLILIPAAVAAATAASGLAGGRRGKGRVVEVQTRMRDEALLAAALAETGAVTATVSGAVVAEWAGVTARFERDPDGIWSAHFTGTDADRAVEIIQAVDVAYGRQVQRAVLARLRERAPIAGLRLESEDSLADDSVRLVFAVEREIR